MSATGENRSEMCDSNSHHEVNVNVGPYANDQLLTKTGSNYREKKQTYDERLMKQLRLDGTEELRKW